MSRALQAAELPRSPIGANTVRSPLCCVSFRSLPSLCPTLFGESAALANKASSLARRWLTWSALGETDASSAARPAAALGSSASLCDTQDVLASRQLVQAASPGLPYEHLILRPRPDVERQLLEGLQVLGRSYIPSSSECLYELVSSWEWARSWLEKL